MKPVFQTKAHEGDVRGNCLRASLASILEIEIEDMPAFEDMPASSWRSELERWLARQGYRLDESREKAPSGCHFIAVGKDRQGRTHAVVALEGKMVHDPYPGGAGIVTFERAWQLIEIERAQIG